MTINVLILIAPTNTLFRIFVGCKKIIYHLVFILWNTKCEILKTILAGLFHIIKVNGSLKAPNCFFLLFLKIFISRSKQRNINFSLNIFSSLKISLENGNISTLSLRYIARCLLGIMTACVRREALGRWYLSHLKPVIF